MTGLLPTRPVWGYRLTQGLHVASGLAAIVLVMAEAVDGLPEAVRLAAVPVGRPARRAADDRAARGRDGVRAVHRADQHSAVVSVAVLLHPDALRGRLDRRRFAAAAPGGEGAAHQGALAEEDPRRGRGRPPGAARGGRRGGGSGHADDRRAIVHAPAGHHPARTPQPRHRAPRSADQPHRRRRAGHLRLGRRLGAGGGRAEAVSDHPGRTQRTAAAAGAAADRLCRRVERERLVDGRCRSATCWPARASHRARRCG